MKIIAISGLGADYRVFNHLTLEGELTVVPWCEIKEAASMQTYVKDLLKNKIPEEPYCLIGVSFGGMLVSEIVKELQADKVVLISTTQNQNELPAFLKVNWPLKLVPSFMFRLPKFIVKHLFGSKHSKELYDILKDTDPSFVKKAIQLILKWKSSANKFDHLRIHGSEDKLIPCPALKGINKVEGGHFVIVDQAKEVSRLINDYIKK